MINLSCSSTATGSASPPVPHAAVEGPEDTFSHCVVKVNYASLGERKVCFVWGWKFFLEEVPFEYLKDGLRKATERAS